MSKIKKIFGKPAFERFFPPSANADAHSVNPKGLYCDPDFPVEKWKETVKRDKTREGYWFWVEEQKINRDL